MKLAHIIISCILHIAIFILILGNITTSKKVNSNQRLGMSVNVVSMPRSNKVTEIVDEKEKLPPIEINKEIKDITTNIDIPNNVESDKQQSIKSDEVVLPPKVIQQEPPIAQDNKHSASIEKIKLEKESKDSKKLPNKTKIIDQKKNLEIKNSIKKVNTSISAKSKKSEKKTNQSNLKKNITKQQSKGIFDIKNENGKSTVNQDTNKTDNSGNDTDDSQNISGNEKNAIITEIYNNWNVETMGTKNMYVKVLIKLDINGNILSREIIENGDSSNKNAYHSFVNTVLEALDSSSPLTKIPSKQKYNSWKEIIIQFDSSGSIE